jgi:hypothetical protein
VSDSWVDAPDLWHTVQLGVGANFVTLPGVARVKGSLGRKLDARSAPGADGGTIVDKGYKLAPVEIEVLLWTDEQYTAWRQASLPLVARRGRQRLPLTIVFPALNDLGIYEVYLEDITALEPSGQARGAWECTVKLLEYAPPSRRNATQRPRAPASTQLTPATPGGPSAASSPPSATNTGPDSG